MQHTDEFTLPGTQPADWQAAEEELLDRAREVGRRIVERVQKVMDDTRADQTPLPDDGTDEAAPVA